MKNIKKLSYVLIVAAVIILSFSVASFADTTIISTGHSPYFHSGDSAISSVFYFLGDVVMFPFRFVGNLFS